QIAARPDKKRDERSEERVEDRLKQESCHHARFAAELTLTERRDAEVELHRGQRERLPLIEVDACGCEQAPHTRSRAEINSEASRVTSRTPVSWLKASSRLAVPVWLRMS